MAVCQNEGIDITAGEKSILAVFSSMPDGTYSVDDVF